MAGKIGRPKSDNPRSVRLALRLDEEETRKLDEIAEYHKETRTEAIRRGIIEAHKAIKK